MSLIKEVEALKIETSRRSLFFVMLFLAVYTASVFYFQSLDSATPTHGDVFTDAASILAAKNFNEFGFIKLKFAELFIFPPPVENFTAPILYLHHPVFQVVILALFYRLGLSTLQARIFPLFISVLGLLATYLLGKKVFNEDIWGWAAMLAVAAAAPFRLLSDQLFTGPYVFAIRAWAFYVIASTTCAPLAQRRKWLQLLGIFGFAAITIAGWESLLAICIFAILFPVFFDNKNPAQKIALIKDLILVLGFGIGLGGLLLTIHNLWVFGGIQPFITDITIAFLNRSSPPPVNGLIYIFVIFVRLIRFYPLHMLAIFPILPIVLRALKIKSQYKLPDRILKFILILILSESAWYLLFREHTYQHDHTINLLALTIGFLTALSIKLFYNLTGLFKISKWFFFAPLIILWIAAFFNFLVIPYSGNIQVKTGVLASVEQRIGLLTSKLNKSKVIVLEKDYSIFQNYAFYQLGYMYVEPLNANIIMQNTNYEYYYAAKPFSQKYNEYLKNYLLKSIVSDLAIFDPTRPPGALNQIWAIEKANIFIDKDRNPAVLAFLLNSPLASTPQELTFSLQPDQQQTISFLIAQPYPIVKGQLSDGVDITFVLTGNGEDLKLMETKLTPANKGWTALDIPLPNHTKNSLLKIVITCGLKNDCNYDEVLLAPISIQ